MKTCPSSQTLEQFVAVTLSPAEADELIEHLESCTTCSERLKTLEQNRRAGVAGGFRDLWNRKIEMSNTLPKRIDKYEIVAKIGEGGMGTVYQAWHPGLQMDVAVKVLKETRLDNATARSRFSKEIEAIGRLRHENIVQAIDAGIADDVPFITMELLDGCDLGEYVTKNGPLPVEYALSLIRQAATGLGHAHAVGLIHRDVKPSNLFLTSNGFVKWLDLGIARPIGSENRETKTETGHVVGSPEFMAPEQFRGGTVDVRSDIYSLGCTLAYLLTGKPLSESHDALPTAVRTLVSKMTAGMPDQRFSSTGELIAAFDVIEKRKTSLRYLGAILACVAVVVLAGVFLMGKNSRKEIPTKPITPLVDKKTSEQSAFPATPSVDEKSREQSAIPEPPFVGERTREPSAILAPPFIGDKTKELPSRPAGDFIDPKAREELRNKILNSPEYAESLKRMEEYKKANERYKIERAEYEKAVSEAKKNGQAMPLSPPMRPIPPSVMPMP